MSVRARQIAALVCAISSVVASTGLARAISIGAATTPWAMIAACLWIASMVSTAIAAPRGDGPVTERRGTRDPVIGLLVILVVGFAFRSVALDRLPWGYAGVNLDAVYNSDIAFRILDRQQSFAPAMPSIVYTRDVLTQYYLALFYAFGGRTIQTLRFACNVLALLNCVLLFAILRRYTTSVIVVMATTLLYALSGPDTIFGLSGMEYIATTPFVLGGLVLFERALRTGTSRAATAAGLVWGLGVYSHYPYLFILPVLPVLALLHFRSTKRWLPTFLFAGLVAVVPKACYLAFNPTGYFARFLDVARHDAAGHFLVAEHFRNSARNLVTLLFYRQPGFKTLLPEAPIIPPLQAAIAAVGLGVALRRPTRPEHFVAIAVVVFTVLVNLGAFVQDYRLINTMPVVFLLTGIGLLRLEAWLGGGRLAWFSLTTIVGVLIVQSVSGYFADCHDNPACRDLVHYGTEEVALAQAVAQVPPTESPYVLTPLATHRLDFFNLARHGVSDLTAGFGNDMQLHYSTQGARRIIQNADQILRREAGRDALVRFIISEESGYARDVEEYLAAVPEVHTSAMEVTDRVSQRTIAYRAIVIPHPVTPSGEPRRDVGVLASVSDRPEGSRLGKLWLRTFADPHQRLLRDEREVPALLDFDFASRTPYPADWIPPFSLRWSGWLHAARTGEYRIEATYDDGCRVFLDRRLLLDDWAVGGSRTRAATVSMQEGWHRLLIDYFQVANEAVFALRIGDGTGPAIVIPAGELASGPALPEQGHDGS